MKKLFALLAAGSLLALTTGCPPGTTTGPGITPPGGSTSTNPTPNPMPNPGHEPKTITGKVTKSEGGKITVKPETGEAKDYTISDDKVVTIDGKAGKAESIKAGDTATVTWDKEGKVTAVEVKPAGAGPVVPNPNTSKEGTLTGKVTKSEGGKITVKPETGEAKDYTISDDKVVTIDGKAGKAENIKTGDTATVTWDKEGKVTAVEVKPAGTGPTPLPAPPKEAKGKVKSIDKDKVVVTDDKGMDWDLTLAPDAKVTINDKADSKAEDIKKGAEVTATLKDGKTITEIKATNPK